MWLARYEGPHTLIQFFLYPPYRCIRSEAHILHRKRREEIEDRRCGDTYDVAHFAMYVEIAEPMDVSKPAECRNYSLQCTLCSGFSLFIRSRFSLSAVVGPTLSRTHATFSLPPSLRFHLSGQPRSPVSRLSSCDSPTPLCVNSCTHRQRIPTGEHTAGNVYLA